MRKRVIKLLRIVGMLFLFVLVMAIGALSVLPGYSVSWTGFGDFITPTGEFVRGKTVWDWMELFIVPLSLIVGGYFLNRSERDAERRIAKNHEELERELSIDRQREAALQAYIDRMADLLLNYKLRTSRKKEVRHVARMRTLTALRGLDPRRKRLLLMFLKESGLIDLDPVIDMTGADLSGADLNTAYLPLVNLHGAILNNSNLNGAVFLGANLCEAHLKNINPLWTTFDNADLSSADLTGNKFEMCSFRGADLSGAYLSGADFMGDQFGACDLDGADLHLAILVGINGMEDAKISPSQLAVARLNGAT